MAIVIRQVSVTSHSRHYALQGFTQNTTKAVSSLFAESSTKDVFGQDRSKLKGSETSRYFECGNCGRKVSGGRFASHINKCLDRNRKDCGFNFELESE